MKNIVLVFKGNSALALDNNGGIVKKTSAGSFLANLEVLTDILNTIPAGEIAPEITTVHIPDFIQGLASGTALDYIRTGKTKSGSQLTAQEVEAFKNIYKMISERIYNVRFSLAKYIPKTNTELIALRTNAYNALTTYVASNGFTGAIGMAPVQQQIIDPDKALREALDAQIIEAINKGDMKKMAELKAMRDTLKEPTMVQGTVQQSVMNNGPIPTPNFGMDNNVVADTNDNKDEKKEELQDTTDFTNENTANVADINWNFQ